MDTELALKINKYIHEQCVDGVPHDIGWNVVKLFCQPAVSGSATDFEMELYKLINRYVDAELKKPDLIHKMEYVTQSCRVS